MKDFQSYSLLAHNTFGIDVKCRRFIEYTSVEEAQSIVRSLKGSDYPLLILGGGSNLLLTKDYEGTVIHSGINYLRQIDNERVECGSGYNFDDFVAYCTSHQLYGAENLSIIPGEVGASAVQNIGAYGVEAKDLIETVTAIDIATGNICVFQNKECGYSYRQSNFKNVWHNKYLITSVVYKLQSSFEPKLDYGNVRKALSDKGITHPTSSQLRDTIIEIRNAKLPDPKIIGNGGSFFMNPIIKKDKYDELTKRFGDIPHYTIDENHEKIPAGWMIEQCGWKGRRIGNVGVYDKQALVLVNHGGASGAEVVNLCRLIQEDIYNKFGVEIRPEVNII